MKKYLFIFVIIALFAGCNNVETMSDKFKKMDWLLGSWQADLGKTSMHETWNKISDTAYYGEGFELDKDKKTFEEQLDILAVNGVPVYRVSVNKNKPVDFWLTQQTDTSVIFENPEHDFPQRIVYVQKSSDVIYAYADGNEKGVYHKEEFLFLNKKQQ